MNKLKFKNIGKLNAILGLSFVLGTSLTGCKSSQTLTDDVTEIYTTIDSNENGIKETEPQIVNIEGEDFKLEVKYYLDKEDSKDWHITSNKELFVEASIKGMPEDTKIWIDNVHTDTYIIATTEAMNGIKQDSMDDHSHNTEILGFPISDTVKYHGIIEIEGQDKDFIQGSSYGFNGYSNGTINQRRYSESEYLEKTVYANEIISVFDLWVQKGENEPYITGAKSRVVVIVDNEVTKIEKDKDDVKIKVYRYDRKGNSEVISEKDYDEEKEN